MAVGLEVPCWIISKAQPLMIARLQAYFEERIWAFISVLYISATDISATDISATDISATDISANGHFGHGHFVHGKIHNFASADGIQPLIKLPFKINMFDHYKLTQ